MVQVSYRNSYGKAVKNGRVQWTSPLCTNGSEKLLRHLRIKSILRGYCTSGPYFWRFCAFSQKIKQPRTKYPMDLVRNVPRNSKITILLQCRPLLWSYSEKCAKINIFHVLSHKSITAWVSETPVQYLMLPIRNISYLLSMYCSFWEKCKNSPKTGLGCSTPLRYIKQQWL